MDEKPEKERNNLETFLYMLRTTRYCAKECETLKIDKVLDDQDLQCLSFFFFVFNSA